MKKITNNLLNESYFYEVLDNGLQVFLVPKKDLNRSYAMLSIKYGSLNQEFTYNNADNIIKTPAGVAHFLEHKMFEMPNHVDATTLFAELGADVNAYTSYENTSYYFSTVSNFYESLELLLDFVQTPCFIEESVENEKGIIEQEIMASLDRPSSVCYHGILRNLFKNNKIIEDIGGSIESIQMINASLLQQCYDVFYHPSNMILVVVGNFELKHALEIIKTNQNNKTFKPYLNPQTVYYLEDNKVNQKDNFSLMDVNINTIYIGLKIDLRDYSPAEIEKVAILIDFIMDELFAYSSDNYQKWLREKLIDYSFEYSFSLGNKYAYLMIGGETKEEALFSKTINDVLLNIPNIEFNQERFANYIRSYKGYEIRKFNSVEAIANSINDRELDGNHLFDTIELLEKLSFLDIKDVYKFFAEDALSTFVVKKNK